MWKKTTFLFAVPLLSQAQSTEVIQTLGEKAIGESIALVMVTLIAAASLGAAFWVIITLINARREDIKVIMDSQEKSQNGQIRTMEKLTDALKNLEREILTLKRQ